MEEVLYVEWIDSGAMKGHWNDDFEDFEKSMNKCSTVGFIVSQSENWLVICSTLGEKTIDSNSIGNLTYIYKLCITKQIELKEKTNETK